MAADVSGGAHVVDHLVTKNALFNNLTQHSEHDEKSLNETEILRLDLHEVKGMIINCFTYSLH